MRSLQRIAGISVIVFGSAGALVACQNTGTTTSPTLTPTTTVTTDISDGETIAQNAINAFSGIETLANGLAILQPSYAPAITAAETLAAPIVAKLQLALTDGETDVVTVQALVNQLATQQNALLATSQKATRRAVADKRR